MKQKGVVNTSKSSSRSVPLRYVALVSQSGTDAPTATVLENTIGDIVWTRDQAGRYAGTTLNSAFPINKTSTMSVATRAAGDASGFMEVYRQSDTTIWMDTYLVSDLTSRVDDVIAGQPLLVEILVY